MMMIILKAEMNVTENGVDINFFALWLCESPLFQAVETFAFKHLFSTFSSFLEGESHL